LAFSVYILAVDSSNLNKCLRDLAGVDFTWAYLGQSISDFKRLQNGIGGNGSHIDTTNSFHEASMSLRGPYLNFLYQIGKQLNSLHWWNSALSCRNGYTSKTFHQACYLKVGLELVQNKGVTKPLVLLMDKPVAQALEDNLQKGADAEIYVSAGSRPNWIETARDVASLLTRRAFFVFREGSRIIESRLKIHAPYVPTKPTTVLFSWLTAENLPMKGDFHKSFFGDLAKNLGEMGCDIAVSPIILRQVRYREALGNLKGSSLPMMAPHRYIGMLHLLRAVLSSCKKPPLPSFLPTLCDMNIRALVTADHRIHWISNGSADALMHSMVIRKWANRKFPISKIIYVFENQPYERAICWETRDSFPNATIVGYQHARVAPLILQVNLTDGGEPDSPLPDWIVTLGKHATGLMLSAGHQTDNLRDGGALQMQGLLAQKPNPAGPLISSAKPSVLVATGRREEAMELVDLALQIFSEDDGVNIVIKYHPAYPLSEVGALSNDEVFGHISVSERPITELMIESSVMIYSSSTVCVEAIALGVPTIHIRTQFDLDIDALSSVPDLRLEATGLDEIREKVWWLLNNRAEYVADHQESWDSFINDMYSPVSEDTYRAFLGPTQDAATDAESSASGQPATAQD
jgi:hypothetical protein